MPLYIDQSTWFRAVSPIGNENMAELEDRWLSVDEIGKHLGVSNDTVYRWIDKHAMPC